MMSANENYEIARQTCIHKNWHFQEPRENLIRMSFNVGAKFHHFDVVLDVKPIGIITYGLIPLRGDEETEANLIKYLTMANYALIDGNFEYDVTDGEIRFKSFVPSYGDLTETAVERSVGVTVQMVGRYGNGIAKLSIGLSDPETEIKAAEDIRYDLLARLAHLKKEDDGDGEGSEAERLSALEALLERLKGAAREQGIDMDDDDGDDD